MHERDEAARQARHGRMTGLSAAILRIGATLDLDTVLNEVVETVTIPRSRGVDRQVATFDAPRRRISTHCAQ